MGGSVALTEAYLNCLHKQTDIELIIASGSSYLHPLFPITKTPNIKLSGQDCSHLCPTHGAYTGETSALQLKELGCKYCIIGHSERRQHLKETPEILRKKLQNAISQGLTPIYCIGETQSEYQAKNTKKVLAEQLSVLKGLNPSSIIIAYEPVWAIGSGLVPQPVEIKEVTNFVIAQVKQNGYVSEQHYRIAYGGSVTANNTSAIMRETGVHGILVGSHSLEVSRLEAILKAML